MATLFVAVGVSCSSERGTDRTATTSSETERAVSLLLGEWTGRERVPGAVLLVSERDGTQRIESSGRAQIYAYGSGQYPDADAPGIERLEEPVRLTLETPFDLASVTKVMATTMAVMLLVDRGEIDLDAAVSTWLPDFTGDGRDAITPRHLLTHRSGLPQWLPVYYHADSAPEAYAFLRTTPLEWAVGAERHYSDLGFMLLGLLVERITSRPLDRFVAEEIYEPLGLERTGFRPNGANRDAADGGPRAAATSHGNPFEYRMVHDSGFGYRIDGDPDAWDGWRRRTLVGEVNDGNAYHAFEGVAGHAGLFSTAADLDALLRVMLDGGRARGVRLVSPETVSRFLEPQGDGQALGWQLPDWAPEGAFAHTGFTGTFVMGMPHTGRAIVLLTNRQNVGVDAETSYPDVGPLQRDLAALLAGG